MNRRDKELIPLANEIRTLANEIRTLMNWQIVKLIPELM